MQHYVIKFISYLWRAYGSLQLSLPYFLKVVLNTIALIPYYTLNVFCLAFVNKQNAIFQQLHDYLSEDNNITKAEFISQFTHNSPGLNPIANGLFLEFDMNHDDTITHQDIDKYYMKLDTNGKNTNNTKNLCFSLWHTFVEIRQV